MTSETLSIDGMHCDHCVEAVRTALQSLDGVSVDAVEIGRARVTYDSKVVSGEGLTEAISEAGYDVVS